jgi:uncharacterized protein (DUF3820 family)
MKTMPCGYFAGRALCQVPGWYLLCLYDYDPMPPGLDGAVYLELMRRAFIGGGARQSDSGG